MLHTQKSKLRSVQICAVSFPDFSERPQNSFPGNPKPPPPPTSQKLSTPPGLRMCYKWRPFGVNSVFYQGMCVHISHISICSFLAWCYIASLVPRPSPAPVFDRLQHTASDQKLEPGKAWERGYYIATYNNVAVNFALYCRLKCHSSYLVAASS